MIYDLIIIGAGAAGLFAGASLPSPVKGLILDQKASPGKKLLMSGAGQCNLTHGGNIKDFISHYGQNGSAIRTVLYRFSNRAVIDFFEKRGISLVEREDEKIFPKSLKAMDILNVLTKSCVQNGLEFRFSSPVAHISFEKLPNEDSRIFTVHSGEFIWSTKKLLIASGGCSYPASGSDGSLFRILKRMDISFKPLVPSLVPVYVHQYPYKDLSGISFPNASVAVFSDKGKKLAENLDALLLTHKGFSGPAILNLSRSISQDLCVSVNYFPLKQKEIMIKELSSALTGNPKQILTLLNEYFNGMATGQPAVLPKRFLEAVCLRAGIDSTTKASQLRHSQLQSFAMLITQDRYRVVKTGGFEIAMVTSGGVELSEVNLKTMESKKYPGLYFAGEVLDVDGDTGGYNLQFAFSSGNLAANSLISH